MKQISARRNFSCLLIAGALAGSVSILPIPANQLQAKAADKKVTLDEMWKDDAVGADLTKSAGKKTDKKPETKTVDTDTNFKIEIPEGVSSTTKGSEKEEVAEEPQEKSEEKTATEKTDSNSGQASSEPRKIKPLCSLSELKQSTLVKDGGWPGVGPFKNQQADALLDEHNNKLEMKSEGEHVKEASLKLVNHSNNLKDLLALQMTTDFFLEALGASGNKIAAFNKDLEQKQETLSNLSAEGMLTLSAGPYEVSIAKDGNSEDTTASANGLLISVKNTELVPLVEEKPETKDTDSSTDTRDNTDSTSTTDSTVSEKENPSEEKDLTPKVSSSDSGDNTSEETESVLDKPIVYNAGSSSTTKIASRPPVGSTATPGTTSGADKKDLLKQQFTTLISTWQSIKRRAVKNRQKENLTRILGGKALATQSQAIKFLLEKHRYYEMTPGSMEVTSYKALTPGRKYEVVAKISERRRYIDADNLRILKDQKTNYTVSYIVEQIRGQWLITDSKVVK